MLIGLGVAVTLFVSLWLEGSGDARKRPISTTGRVIIDGKSFIGDDSSVSEASILERELSRMGVRLPAGFNAAKAAASAHPAFEGRLKADGSRAVVAPRLPAGLTPEHSLRMEGEGRPVELVFGSMGAPGSSIRSRLISSGWKSISSGKDSRAIHVMQGTCGKETTIVCLDEAEGTFLLFREVGR